MGSRRAEYSWPRAAETSALLVGLMGLVLALNWVLPVDLRALGIVPRTLRGLVGIPLAPLLHLGFGHLAANALPLFTLATVLFAHRRYLPVQTLTWVWAGSGVGTWLIGRGDAVHIGASSLIYGLAVYLVAAGWWMRSWRSVVVAALVLLFYGGLIYGLLPQRGAVSWEGHLAGALSGLVAAWKSHKRPGGP